MNRQKNKYEVKEGEAQTKEEEIESKYNCNR